MNKLKKKLDKILKDMILDFKKFGELSDYEQGHYQGCVDTLNRVRALLDKD